MLIPPPVAARDHVHYPDQPCSTCLLRAGKPLPANVLVTPHVRVNRAKTRLAIETRYIAARYRKFDAHTRLRIRQLFDLLAAGSSLSVASSSVLRNRANGASKLLIFRATPLQLLNETRHV